MCCMYKFVESDQDLGYLEHFRYIPLKYVVPRNMNNPPPPKKNFKFVSITIFQLMSLLKNVQHFNYLYWPITALPKFYLLPLFFITHCCL